jgi:signal transduction histidine kinase
MLIFISIALGLLALLLLSRLIQINLEIQGITRQLTAKQKLKTTMGNKAIENLCEGVNQRIEDAQAQTLAADERETRLKESIANISHDLRTPLTSITGYLELMKTNPDKIPEYEEILKGRIQVLRDLVESFYELSTTDEIKDLELDTVDLCRIVSDCLLGAHTQFEARQIEPDIQIPNAPIFIIGNTLACERICQNLIQNALKYAVSRIVVELTQTHQECVLSIFNDSEEDLSAVSDRLFDRFYTANLARSNGNTGIGLYLVKTLVEKMHGEILPTEIHDLEFGIKIRFALSSLSGEDCGKRE